jgi:hypothetical protein
MDEHFGVAIQYKSGISEAQFFWMPSEPLSSLHINCRRLSRIFFFFLHFHVSLTLQQKILSFLCLASCQGTWEAVFWNGFKMNDNACKDVNNTANNIVTGVPSSVPCSITAHSNINYTVDFNIKVLCSVPFPLFLLQHSNFYLQTQI